MAKSSLVPQNLVDYHMPTVVVSPLGELNYTTETINTVKLDNKIIKVLPDSDEKIVSLQDNKELFSNLEFVDIILTNACNLSCAYCYEQHNKDYGRFTPETVRKVWDWLRDINDNFPKYIQFFGGEPLIHKKLILDFMRENKDELERMKDKMAVSITTNGLLLTKEFVDEFFSYPNVKMMISLDTVDAELDHRGISQSKINKLLDMIEYVATKVKHPDNLAVRATITRAGSPYLKTLWNEVYKRGVRQLIFHPLILSLGEGYVEWPQNEWDQFCNDIKTIIKTHPDIEHFQVVEGVGAKGKTNCLVGSDEIAVDASGDFTGCYFFTNRKGDIAGKTLLGNIHDDTFYAERYKGFVANYEKMYEEYDECKTCSVKNLCYQCPAGNVATVGKLFKPDAMCKRIITLYSEINELMMQNKFTHKLNMMKIGYEQHGDKILSRSLVHLMSYFFEDEKSDSSLVNYLVDYSHVLPSQLLGYFAYMIDYADRPDSIKTEVMTPNLIVERAVEYNLCCDAMTVYNKVRECEGLPSAHNFIGSSVDEQTIITLMHFLIMNTSEIRKRS